MEINSLEICRLVEVALREYLNACPDTQSTQAARYTVLAGGQRWRAQTTIAAGLALDLDAVRTCMPMACAIELVHAATLVLDDRPSMDNSTTRRGKPCLHLVYPEWVVDMAPVFLVNLAYCIVMGNPHVSAERKVDVVGMLGSAGADICRGQEMDLSHPPTSLDQLIECHRLKTGVLFAASMRSAGLLGGGNSSQIQALGDCGMNMGIAFQLQDDIADFNSDVPTDPGHRANPYNAARQSGVDNILSLAQEYSARSLRAIEGFGPSANLLRSIVGRATQTSTVVQPGSV